MNDIIDAHIDAIGELLAKPSQPVNKALTAQEMWTQDDKRQIILDYLNMYLLTKTDGIVIISGGISILLPEFYGYLCSQMADDALPYRDVKAMLDRYWLEAGYGSYDIGVIDDCIDCDLS